MLEITLESKSLNRHHLTVDNPYCHTQRGHTPYRNGGWGGAADTQVRCTDLSWKCASIFTSRKMRRKLLRRRLLRCRLLFSLPDFFCVHTIQQRSSQSNIVAIGRYTYRYTCIINSIITNRASDRYSEHSIVSIVSPTKTRATDKIAGCVGTD